MAFHDRHRPRTRPFGDAGGRGTRSGGGGHRGQPVPRPHDTGWGSMGGGAGGVGPCGPDRRRVALCGHEDADRLSQVVLRSARRRATLSARLSHACAGRIAGRCHATARTCAPLRSPTRRSSSRGRDVVGRHRASRRRFPALRRHVGQTTADSETWSASTQPGSQRLAFRHACAKARLTHDRGHLQRSPRQEDSRQVQP